MCYFPRIAPGWKIPQIIKHLSLLGVKPFLNRTEMNAHPLPERRDLRRKISVKRSMMDAMKKATNSEPLVTVIVCTHNRRELLTGCLAALTRQDAPPERFAVLVVDNASTDGTQELVAEVARTASYALNLVEEPALGLSRARNTGAMACKSPWLAYVDDDAMPLSGWISAILAFIDAHSKPGVFGGPHLPFYITPPPRWLPGDLGRFWQGDRVIALPWQRCTLIGCNFITHRAVFEAVGGFDPNLGVYGQEVRYGEETMFYRKALELGFPVHYTPAPVVEHLVRPEKYRLGWHAASLVELGKSLARKLGPIRAFPTALAIAVLCPLLTLVNFGVFLDVPFTRRLYFALHPPCYAWGMIAQCGRFLRDVAMPSARKAKSAARLAARDQAGPGPV